MTPHPLDQAEAVLDDAHDRHHHVAAFDALNRGQLDDLAYLLDESDDPALAAILNTTPIETAGVRPELASSGRENPARVEGISPSTRLTLDQMTACSDALTCTSTHRLTGVSRSGGAS